MPGFLRLIEKSSRRVVGLMPENSFRGVGAVLVMIKGFGPDSRIEVEKTCFQHYSEELRSGLLELNHPESVSLQAICRLDGLLGKVHAEAVQQLAKEAGVPPGEIDLIGCEGQMICQELEPANQSSQSFCHALRIGDAALIADRTDICTVTDFRRQGSTCEPEVTSLIPYADFVLFHSSKRDRAVMNIGGIGSVTILPRECSSEEAIGFDGLWVHWAISEGRPNRFGRGPAFDKADVWDEIPVLRR